MPKKYADAYLWRMEVRFLDAYIDGLTDAVRHRHLYEGGFVPEWISEALRRAQSVRAQRGDQLELPI